MKEFEGEVGGDKPSTNSSLLQTECHDLQCAMMQTTRPSETSQAQTSENFTCHPRRLRFLNRQGQLPGAFSFFKIANSLSNKFYDEIRMLW
eukprot:s3812_g3.t1